jgi:hypothetical protein
MNIIYKLLFYSLLLTLLACAVANQEVEAKEYTVEIGRIHDWFDDEEIVELLDSATKDDIVKFEIDTIGGRVDKTFNIVQAIIRTEATTHMYIYKAYSAGAIIGIVGDRIYVNEDSKMMFHLSRTRDCFEYILYGNTCVLLKDNPENTLMLDMIRYFAGNLVTPKEFKQIENGKDVYIYGPELIKRLVK